jgi:hypothetical protein
MPRDTSMPATGTAFSNRSIILARSAADVERGAARPAGDRLLEKLTP